jgi:hypothetical protein
MKRIDTTTKAVDLFGAGKPGFKDGDPVSGTPSTQLNALWFNNVQEEIANVIESTGVVLDPSHRDQLLTAIQSMIGGVTTGKLLRRRKLITSGTLVKATDLLANAKRIIVWCYGASGGSGGAKGIGSAAPQGGNSGAGGTAMKSILVSALLASESYIIGAKGIAGTAMPTDGGDGGNTSFGTTPYLSATGGKGGARVDGSTWGTATGDGGIGLNGDINLKGNPGMNATYTFGAPTILTTTPGAASVGPFGYGGPPSRLTPQATAINGQSPDANSAAGATGGQAAYNNASSTAAGAAGSDGFIILEEYDG